MERGRQANEGESESDLFSPSLLSLALNPEAIQRIVCEHEGRGTDHDAIELLFVFGQKIQAEGGEYPIERDHERYPRRTENQIMQDRSSTLSTWFSRRSVVAEYQHKADNRDDSADYAGDSANDFPLYTGDNQKIHRTVLPTEEPAFEFFKLLIKTLKRLR